ncbi:MAG: GAF domain-containing protein [Chloroflexi bacterium]|nr:MAG: GAF domain-containing protein [Chloroflexota bacterium]
MSKKKLRNRLDNLLIELEQEATFAPIVGSQSLPGWSWECDPEGLYIFCSSEVVNVLDIEPEAFIGQSLFSYQLQSKSSETVKETILSGKFPAELSVQFICSNGTFIQVKLVIFGIMSEDDVLEGYRGFAQRISEAFPVIQHAETQPRDEAIILPPVAPARPPSDKRSVPPDKRSVPPHRQPKHEHPKDTPVVLRDTGPAPSLPPSRVHTGRVIARPMEEDAPATILVPVNLQENNHGILEIVDETPGRVWSEDERRLVEQVSDQLSQALENAYLFQAEQRRASELNTLVELSRLISQNLDLEDVFSTAYEIIGRLMPAESFFINLLDENSSEFIGAFIIDRGKRYPVSRYPANIGFSGYVISTGESFLARDMDVEELPFQRQVTLGSTSQLRSVIAVPLRYSDKITGSLSVQSYNPYAYSDYDLKLLGTFADHIAIAVQNARLYQQSQETLAETETLYMASAELNAVDSYENILAVIKQFTILNHPDTGVISIHLFDRPWEDDQIPDHSIVVARWSRTPYMDKLYTRQSLRNWVSASQLLRPDQPTIISDTSTDPRTDKSTQALFIDRLGAKALLFTPLYVGGEWIGFISAAFTEPMRFADNEVKRLMALSSQAATSIQNLHLLEESRRRAAQLETAAVIARDTSGTLALDTLLRRAVNQIRDRYGFYHASIFLVDENGLQASIRESTGEAGEEMKRRGHKLPVGSRSIIGYVTESGKPLVLNDVSQDPLHRPNPLLPETRSEIGLPLKIGNRVIGALDVQSNEINAFSDDDVNVVQTLADQIAVAVDNAKSYELAQQAIEETRQRVSELSVLFSVSQSLAGAAMESEEIANIIAQRFIELINIPNCSVSIIDQETNQLRILYELARSRDSSRSVELEPTSRIGTSYSLSTSPAVRRVFESLLPLVVQASDPAVDPFDQEYMRRENIATMVIIPMAVKGQAIGMIRMEAWDIQRSLSSNQLNLSMIMSNAAAVALENARLYDEQRQATEKLRELDKIKSQFLANMSHELRTPLNSIIGFSRVILKGIDGPITELQQQDLSAIYNAGQHLLDLINNILDISKIEAGKMELVFDEHVSLYDLINSVMGTAAGLIKDKPIKLEKEIQAELPPVRADVTRIRQVILNLMSNAIKFTDSGLIKVCVGTREGHKGRQEILIRVIDTGMGISLEDQKKLFKPFSQVDDSPTRKTGGTGLGLSICRLLVEMHGGRIGVDSEAGKGSTFWFSLPLPGKESLRKTGESGLVVLAIDDEKPILNLYDRYLSTHGYQVVPLTDPTNVVARAKEIKPFAITLDVMMPGKDGWSVLEDLKHDPETRNIPVVICSILEEMDKGFSLGAADYLMKPILEEDLVTALARLNKDGSIQEVLVIDDDEDDLRLVEKILSKETQYHLSFANSGAQGLAAIKSSLPHAVILDLFMPGIDGFTILEAMRSDSATRDIPVIVFTAADLSDEQKEKLSQFTKNMLKKGLVKEEDLLASIEAALKRFEG